MQNFLKDFLLEFSSKLLKRFSKIWKWCHLFGDASFCAHISESIHPSFVYYWVSSFFMSHKALGAALQKIKNCGRSSETKHLLQYHQIYAPIFCPSICVYAITFHLEAKSQCTLCPQRVAICDWSSSDRNCKKGGTLHTLHMHREQ